jgi:hypothetical protein
MTLSVVFLAVYLGSFVGLNAICFLISSFYRRRVQEPSPRAGFLLGALASLALAVLALVPSQAGWLKVVQILLLCFSAAASGINTVGLYYTMKRVRK